MRPFAVRFRDDPEDSLRLVLAQDGQAFLVGRADHDGQGLPGGIWFEFGDERGAEIVAHFTADHESWGLSFNASPGGE